ncbi:MAG: GNAT family N-acetyltransferase [Gemmatimonadales bacterium]|nr:GNAT family N-acetyltransferase [Gemmatimonadales bacterium]
MTGERYLDDHPAGNPVNNAGLTIEIGDAAPSDWNELVASDPDSDYFHTRIWTETISRCYPDKISLWLTVRLQKRLVAGMAILHSIGRRVDLLESSLEGTSGGPIIARDLPVDFAGSLFMLLIDHFYQLRSGFLGSLSLSLNSGHEARFGFHLAGDSRWVRHEHSAAVISLAGGIDEVERGRMNKTKRNERNRALRRGVELEVTKDPELVAEYYPIYLRASEKWGIEPAPLILLQELLAASTDSGPGEGRAFFTCVRIEGRVVGGHLNLHYGDRVIAWNGVTDPKFSREHFPATAAIWGDLVESCRRGASWLDLGGSGGVIKLDEFKQYFGAEEIVRGWYVSETLALRGLRAGRSGLQHLLSKGKGYNRTIDRTDGTGQAPES